jgi:hypothetical protein
MKELCIVCCEYEQPAKMVLYYPGLDWLAHPACRELDERRGAFK